MNLPGRNRNSPESVGFATLARVLANAEMRLDWILSNLLPALFVPSWWIAAIDIALPHDGRGVNDHLNLTCCR